MSDSHYDVGSRVTIDARQAQHAARQLVSDLDRIGARIRSNNSLVSGMTAKLAAVGATYLGFNALTNTIARAGRAMYQLEAETTQTGIGLASVFSAIEGISFGKAQGLAEKVYGQLSADAIESVATTKELFEIYAGIVGPIRAAGFELDKVRDITKDVVNASSALGVDFPQAKRDVAAMVRGAAGMDVKLFQTLRSMNLIKEDAKTFNTLMQADRVTKIADALKKAGVGGAAFGRSLPGRVSTFVDIVQQFSKAFSGPLFESFAAKLGKVNDYLLANKDSVMAYLSRVGTEMSLRFETVFERAVTGAKWVSAHWDEIVQKAGEVVDRMQVLAPQLARAYVGLAVGRELLGRGFEMASIAGSLGLRFGGKEAGGAVAAKAASKAATAAEFFPRPDSIGAMSFMAARNKAPDYIPSVIGFGAAGAGAGAGAGAAAGGGTTAAAAAAGGASAATVAIVALAGAAVVLGSVFMAANDQWVFAKQTLLELLRPAESLWENLKKLAGHLWDFARPILRLVGGAVFIVLTNALQLMTIALDGVVWVVERVMSVFGYLGEQLDKFVDFGLQQVLVRINSRMKEINEFIYGPKKAKNLEWSGDNAMGIRGGSYSSMPTERGVTVPKQRPMVVNDFRGSKITVKQDFRQGDPDRILRVFVRGLERQAERRIQSPFAPAFSR